MSEVVINKASFKGLMLSTSVIIIYANTISELRKIINVFDLLSSYSYWFLPNFIKYLNNQFQK